MRRAIEERPMISVGSPGGEVCPPHTPHYGDGAVLRRMEEFLGGPTLRTATAMFVQGISPSDGRPSRATPPAALPEFLCGGCEVGRSLWDRRSLIVDLDIEYVNFDFPGEPYLDPQRSFSLQGPSVAVLRALLGGLGIVPLHLLTGRGHHFLWSIRRESRVFGRLVSLGRVAPSLEAAYAVRHPPWGVRVDPSLGWAFAGLGLVMEYLGHRVRDDAGPQSRIPVELGELQLGPSRRGLEIVSIDLSEYGDALHTRRIVLPFSRYLKPWRRVGVVGEHIQRSLAPICVIPDPGTSEEEALRSMRDVESIRDLARESSVGIPEHATEMQELVAAYEASELARFHAFFYADEHEPPARWPETYDRLSPESLSEEAAQVLRHPNDLLLRPVGILAVVRALLEAHWHPRHIAGLIRSKYERDYGWGSRWYLDNATARADYYARLFSGMIAMGRGPAEVAAPRQGSA